MTSPLIKDPRGPVALEVASSYSILRSITFYGILGLLLFGPLAFGAVEPWSLFILQAGSAALLACWALQLMSTSEMQITWNPLFPPMLTFAALIFLQIVLGQTTYRQATYLQLLRYSAYGLLCFVAVQTLRRTRQVKTLTIVFSTFGSALAIFAILQSIASNGKLYWLRTPRFGGWIYGPYVNHNHYAGLMEMLAPVPLIFSLTQYARGPRKMLAVAAASIMAGTIFLSGSRGGMVAFSVQMTILAVLLIRRHGVGKATVGLGVFLSILLGVVVWLGSHDLEMRLASFQEEAHSELAGGTRLAIDRDALHMFARKPLLGWGLGTFPEVYPQFRSFYTNFFINQAHNDYLQLLVETGALGFLVMGWFVTALYWNTAKKLSAWQHETGGAVALAAMLGCTGILVHGLVDFNLQIPANAALFYVLSMLATLRQPLGHPRHSSVQQKPQACVLPNYRSLRKQEEENARNFFTVLI